MIQAQKLTKILTFKIARGSAISKKGLTREAASLLQSLYGFYYNYYMLATVL